MLTQCPHCLTLFRVGPDHLKAAAGQVRCSRCHQVFNALESLQDAPESAINPDSLMLRDEAEPPLPDSDVDSPTEPTEPAEPYDEWQDEHDSGTESAFESQPSNNQLNPMLHDFADTAPADEFLAEIVEKDDGLDPEPDYFTDDSESQMSELLDQDSSSLLLPDTEEPPEPPPEKYPEEFQEAPQPEHGNIVDLNGTPLSTFDSETSKTESPDDLYDFKESILTDEAIHEELGKPDYDSAPGFRPETAAASEAIVNESVTQEETADDDETLNFVAAETKQPRRKSSLLWLIGSLLLLVPLAGQFAWQFRDDLIQHELGRQTLSLLCSIVDCKVPERRALDKIVIQGRNLSTHPEKQDTLFLQVNIVNVAAFEQPFPRLTLSLYNDKGALISRRTFSAGDYLPAEYAHRAMMPTAQPILVEMELVDPGKEVTGFSFDFF
jgi:predicted Zn finger-like uncharacterized protein